MGDDGRRGVLESRRKGDAEKAWSLNSRLTCDATQPPGHDPHDFHCEKGRLLDQDAKPLQIRFICRRTARSLSNHIADSTAWRGRSEAIGTKESADCFPKAYGR